LAGRSRLTCGAWRPWLSRGPSTRGSRFSGRSGLTSGAGRAGRSSWAATACRIALGAGRAPGRTRAGR
jgi:hypothetical protein